MPGLPLEPLNGLDALLLAYIAQVAAWCGRPSWAVVHLHLGAWRPGRDLRRAGGRDRRRDRLAAAAASPAPGRPRAGVPAIPPPAGKCALALRAVAGSARWRSALAAGGSAWRAAAAAPRRPARTACGSTVLDVGQGDAILLQPAAAPAVLVDGGPPGDGLAREARGAGVERLGAAVVTHDESDHAGGIEELLGAAPGRPPALRRRLGRGSPAAAARRRRPAAADLAAATSSASARLRLEVLWPPPELLAAPRAGADPNQLALVLLARWRRFSMLLTADAEAEAVPLDPGPVDVLKVAHHGSDDAGLGDLLERTRPRLAVISVGAGQPLRPSDRRRRSRPSRATGFRPCAPIVTARS